MSEGAPGVRSQESEGSHPELVRRVFSCCSIARWWMPALLAGLVLFGVFIRVEDYDEWCFDSDETFFDNKPMLGVLDGYFYLRTARDLLEGSYQPHDSLRGAPAGAKRAAIPPLLPFTAAAICRLTGWQLDWVGFFLPAFLGALIAVPLFAFGRYRSCTMAGIAAALAGLVAPYAVYRGCMGWFDTDCMNVTFALGAAYCFMRFGNGGKLLIEGGRERSGWNLRAFMKSRFMWMLGGLGCAGLFLWWWDQSPSAVVILSGAPLLAGLALSYRAGSRAGKITLISLAIIVPLLLLGYRVFSGDGFGNWFVMAESQIRHITKQSHGNMPSFALTVSEQSRPSFDYIVKATTGSITVFVVSALGFLLLVFRKPKTAVFLLPVAALGILAVTFSERFLIFLSPLLALGFGHLVGCLWTKSWPRQSMKYVAVAFTAAALFFPLRQLMTALTAWPKTDAARVAGMVKMAERTPEDAVIWSWWDNGYAINYFSRRATVHDGQIHGYQLSRHVATSLAVTNPAVASRFMRLYAQKGRAGVEAVAEARRNDPSAYSVPSGAPPVYLYLDSLMLATAPVWFRFSDEYSKREELIYQPVFDLMLKPDGGIYGEDGLVVDAGEGILRNGTSCVALRQLIVRESKGAWAKQYDPSAGGCFEFMAPRGFGVLMEEDIAETVFNRLFVRMDPAMGEWFQPVVNSSPDYQIWKVLDKK